jgi:hypothetical protein
LQWFSFLPVRANGVWIKNTLVKNNIKCKERFVFYF